MARVLIVGCGCRGQSLARALAADGHAVRGTTRDAGRLAAIEEAGAEGAVADPNRLGTLMAHVEGVSAVCWLLGGVDEAPLHGERLQSMLEFLVDTPVRGFVYEGTKEGAEIVRRAGHTFRMPVEVMAPDGDWVKAVRRVLD